MNVFSRVSLEEKSSLRKKLGIPEEALVYIFSGQFIKVKNTDFLLSNILNIIAQFPNAYCYLLGDGPERNALQSRYESARIVFTGFVETVNNYLHAADIYVSTSRSEGMPNGVLEAMGCGLPVILSDIEQHSEIIEIDKNAGYMFHQDDGADFRDKLRRAQNIDYEQASNAAYRIVHQCFDAKQMSEQYQIKYEKIVENNVNQHHIEYNKRFWLAHIRENRVKR